MWSENGDCLVTRRAAVSSLLFFGSTLLLPDLAAANEFWSTQGEVVSNLYLAPPNISEAEAVELLRHYAEVEAAEIISEANKQHDSMMLRGRPTYDTVYGVEQTRYAGRRDVAGQLPGGVMIDGGGTIYVQAGGGGSVSVGIELPGIAEGMSVGLELPSLASAVTSYGVPIPGDGHYKATSNCEYKIKPYVVYETIDGVRRVYKKVAPKMLYSMHLGKRRIS